MNNNNNALTAAAVHFNNVSFTYHVHNDDDEAVAIDMAGVTMDSPRSSTSVLRNVTFTAEAAKLTVIVGQSGSGKSTILQLIERFYDADEGQVVRYGWFVSGEFVN